MIKVQRPDDGPASWTTAGTRQTKKDCAAYDACPSDYHSGVATFKWKEFRSKKQAKALLVEICHRKCVYCEMRLPSAYLHIEHFRPKAGVRQTLDQGKDDLPGYYWLAYTWDNLLLACHDCNSRFKRTFFPLANPGERARSHHDDVTREDPLFVDPVSQDPRDHIRFDGANPIGITLEGRTTIDWLGLRRPTLIEEREKVLRTVQTYFSVFELGLAHPEIADLQVKAGQMLEDIEAAQRPEAKFSSMVKDYVELLELPAKPIPSAK